MQNKFMGMHAINKAKARDRKINICLALLIAGTLLFMKINGLDFIN